MTELELADELEREAVLSRHEGGWMMRKHAEMFEQAAAALRRVAEPVDEDRVERVARLEEEHGQLFQCLADLVHADPGPKHSAAWRAAFDLVRKVDSRPFPYEDTRDATR